MQKINIVTISILMVLCVCGSLWAQPNPADPTLRLWLKADDLAATYSPGQAIAGWQDASSYGHLMAPREGMNEAPNYQEVDIFGKTVSAVQFIADVGRDRLYEVLGPPANPNDPNDPANATMTDIGDGTPLTAVVVYYPIITGPALGPQTILAKRGTYSCTYSFQVAAHLANAANPGKLIYVTYEGDVLYFSDRGLYPVRWHISGMTIDETGDNDILRFYDNDTMDPAKRMVLTGESTLLGRNDYCVAPLGIGGHMQAGVGEYEPFAGYIAEIILYARVLNAQEMESLQAYLNAKYLPALPDPAEALNPANPDIRLWLAADAITTTRPGVDIGGNPVNYVDSWPDNSSYNTLIATQTTGEVLNDPDNHTPQLVTATNGDLTFSAVNFRQAYDPITPDAGFGGHYSDRLYQQSNLNSQTGGNDPLNIGKGTDMTLFMVYRNPNVNSLVLGPGQCVFAKRGPGGCPYSFNHRYQITDNSLLTYADPLWYDEGMSPSVARWGLMEMQITQFGTGEILAFSEFNDGTRWNLVTSQQIAGRSGPVADDTPFTLAFHAQKEGANANNPWGNGAYERFAGQFAEILVFAKELSLAEKEYVENYLFDKYIPLPTYCSSYLATDLNKDCYVDLQDFAEFASAWLFCNDPRNEACD